MRTNSKTVMTKVEDHVLDYLENMATIQELIEEISHSGYRNDIIYNKAKAYVQGGSFLVYYDDVIKEVARWTGTRVDKRGREYTGPEAWKLYTHLIAKYLEKKIEMFIEGKANEHIQEKIYIID